MRKELILEVARRKFAEKGYSTSLSEVAKDSGIQKQTLYNYFENKDDLFLEVISNETEQYFESRKVEFIEYSFLSSEERLHKMFLSIVKYFSNREKLMFWRWISLIDSEELKKRCRESIQVREKKFKATIHEVFKVGIENGEINEQFIVPLMNTYYALINGVLDSVVLFDDAKETEKFVQNVWSVFWDGIKSKNPGDRFLLKY